MRRQEYSVIVTGDDVYSQITCLDVHEEKKKKELWRHEEVLVWPRAKFPRPLIRDGSHMGH